MTIQRRIRRDILTFIGESIPVTEFDFAKPNRALMPAMAISLALTAFTVVSGVSIGRYVVSQFTEPGGCGECGEQRMNSGNIGQPVEYRGGEMIMAEALLFPENKLRMHFQTSIPYLEEDPECARCWMTTTWSWNGQRFWDLPIEITKAGPFNFFVGTVLPTDIWEWISTAIDADWDEEVYTTGPGGVLRVDYPIKSDEAHDYETDPTLTVPTFITTFNYLKKGYSL